MQRASRSRHLVHELLQILTSMQPHFFDRSRLHKRCDLFPLLPTAFAAIHLQRLHEAVVLITLPLGAIRCS